MKILIIYDRRDKDLWSVVLNNEGAIEAVSSFIDLGFKEPVTFTVDDGEIPTTAAVKSMIGIDYIQRELEELGCTLHSH